MSTCCHVDVRCPAWGVTLTSNCTVQLFVNVTILMLIIIYIFIAIRLYTLHITSFGKTDLRNQECLVITPTKIHVLKKEWFAAADMKRNSFIFFNKVRSKKIHYFY